MGLPPGDYGFRPNDAYTEYRGVVNNCWIAPNDGFREPSRLEDLSSTAFHKIGVTSPARLGVPPAALSFPIDCSQGDWFSIEPQTKDAFTISNPTNWNEEQEITFSIINSTGVALDGVAFGTNYLVAAFVPPANGKMISIQFKCHLGNFLEISRSTEITM